MKMKRMKRIDVVDDEDDDVVVVGYRAIWSRCYTKTHVQPHLQSQGGERLQHKFP